jgi:hypothetical protein
MTTTSPLRHGAVLYLLAATVTWRLCWRFRKSKNTLLDGTHIVPGLDFGRARELYLDFQVTLYCACAHENVTVVAASEPLQHLNAMSYEDRRFCALRSLLQRKHE